MSVELEMQDRLEAAEETVKQLRAENAVLAPLARLGAWAVSGNWWSWGRVRSSVEVQAKALALGVFVKTENGRTELAAPYREAVEAERE